jgi:hypothetical protein
MKIVLDGLKERLEAAKSRLQKAQAVHAAATVELNAAIQNHNVWNLAVQLETTAATTEDQTSASVPVPEVATQGAAADSAATASADSTEESINRTELVREQLRVHPNGMTTAELWSALKGPINNRAYLYSITKRLRDKAEITQRRGKFYLKARPVEGAKEAKEGGLEGSPIHIHVQ